MCRHNEEYRDIHNTLISYDEVLAFFEELEENADIKRYCNGSNESGRWIFQIYNEEFIKEIASVIDRALKLTEDNGPILEVMSGDGKLTEFLQPFTKQQIIATDAKDGRYNIAYPKWVETMDALESIEKFKPSFIIMSWEPYLSMTGIEVIEKDIPTAWIGNPKMCGHPEIFDRPHIAMKSKYTLSRHDSFINQDFKSDIFLFNYNGD